MKKIIFALSALNLALLPAVSFAEQPQPTNISQTTSNVMEIEEPNIGANAEFDENGNVLRLRAVGQADLVFGDSKDIRLATQKATLRAKANLAKYLNERVNTEETIEEIVNEITKNTNNQMSATRETITSQVERIQNTADALLKGVIVLKTDVNKAEKIVTVMVGISPKTAAGADQLNKVLRTDSTQDTNNQGMSNLGSGNDSNDNVREIRKAKNYDNF